MLFGVVGFPNYRRLITKCSQMPVKTILCNIKLCVDEPFYFRFFEIPFQYFVPFLFPQETGSYFGPKTFGIINTFLYALLYSSNEVTLKEYDIASGYELRVT